MLPPKRVVLWKYKVLDCDKLSATCSCIVIASSETWFGKGERRYHTQKTTRKHRCVLTVSTEDTSSFFPSRDGYYCICPACPGPSLPLLGSGVTLIAGAPSPALRNGVCSSISIAWILQRFFARRLESNCAYARALKGNNISVSSIQAVAYAATHQGRCIHQPAPGGATPKVTTFCQ